MALLRVLKGLSSNLGSVSSSKSRYTLEGAVYFTTDTAKLYIDLTSGDVPIRSDDLDASIDSELLGTSELLTENNTPLLDENGDPIVIVTGSGTNTRSTRSLNRSLSRSGASGITVGDNGQLLDEEGNPIYDENGDPVYVDSAYDIDDEGYLLDENGDYILDDNGDPIQVTTQLGSNIPNRIALNAHIADYATNNVAAISAGENGWLRYSKAGSAYTVQIYQHPEYNNYSSGFYKIAVDYMGHISAVTNVTAQDITNLIGLTPTDNTGTVTKVQAGTGLKIGESGSNFTTSGVINHINSVSAKTSFGLVSIKYDNTGHITDSRSASSDDICNALGFTPTNNVGTVTSITPGAGLVKGSTNSGSQDAITTSGTISIGAGSVTNAMLAGSIANSKLTNSSITIAGQSVSLGGSLSAATLKSALSLGSAAYTSSSDYATSSHSHAWSSITGKPTIPTITLNGSSTTSPSFYAPTTAGTTTSILQGNGSNNDPIWTADPILTSIALSSNRGHIYYGACNTYSSSLGDTNGGGKNGLVIVQNTDESSGIQFNGDYISMWSPADSYCLRYFDEDSGTELWYINGNGYSYFPKSYNAVWADYAEFRTSNTETPGRVIAPCEDGIMRMTTQRLEPNARIISDTYGHAVGESKKCRTPVALTGKVLAYTYQSRDKYKIGDCVCAAPHGTVDIMTREEIKEYPDRIIGIVFEVPNYDRWEDTSVDENHSISIEVNDRIWIDVR